MLAASVEKLITPAVGIELAGYLCREQPSTGKYDELYAKVLLLKDEFSQLAWIHCDLLCFDYALAWEIRRKIALMLNTKPANVMLSTTHTHAGPAASYFRKCGALDASYVEFLRQALYEAVQEAEQKYEQVSLHFMETKLEGVSIDRTAGAGKQGHVDNRLPVLALKRVDTGGYMALIANFAMHNVGLSHVNRLISADIAGYAASKVKAQAEGQPVVFVTNGACGNINPASKTDDYSGVQKAGTALAEAIIEAAKNLKSLEDCRISVADFELPLPVEQIDMAQLDEILARHEREFASRENSFCLEELREVIRDWGNQTRAIIAKGLPAEPYLAYVQIFKLGGITWVGINAEVFSQMGDDVRALSAEENLYIVGYANGTLGYIAPRESYKTGGGYAVREAYKFYGGHFALAAGGFELLRERIVETLSAMDK